MFTGEWITCPDCGYEDEDGVYWFSVVASDYDDNADDNWLTCPTCGYEWRL